MKHIAIILLAVLPALVGRAQDTVQSPLMGNYYMETTPHLEYNWRIEWVDVWGDACGVVTKEVVPKGPIKVYGVAACLMTSWEDLYIPDGVDSAEWAEDFWAGFTDTTTEECYEYLGIYLRSGDSLVPHREVMVHKKYDTVAYYFETGKYFRYNPNLICPIYEKYFDSSIAVTDTFYVGTTQRSQWSYLGRSVLPHMGFITKQMHGVGVNEYHVCKYCWPEEGSVHWYWPPRCFLDDDNFYLIFPILTPDPNAPEDPGDTTGVSQADMVSRYVTVQPNPATEEARVLSSFGIERIDAYTGDGRCILSQKADGLQAVLDVRGWASGTYLLRVTTPMGTTTKKLLVR